MGYHHGTGIVVDEALYLRRIDVAGPELDIGESWNSARANHHVDDVGDRVGRQHDLLPRLDQLAHREIDAHSCLWHAQGIFRAGKRHHLRFDLAQRPFTALTHSCSQERTNIAGRSRVQAKSW